MRVVPQVIAALKADATLTSLVAGRIYADIPPQDDFRPMVVVTTINGIAYGTLNGCQVRAYQSRLTVDSVAESRALSEEIAERVEDILDGFANLADPTHPIQGVVIDGNLEWVLLEPVDGSDQRGFLTSQDFMVNYRRI